MQSHEIRARFLKFFEKRGHKIIPSSSLVPADPTVLFTTAGMQQFKEYYTNPKDATKDFGSLNVATVQKCIRTGDIEEVGDDTHLTFFEMLGNFSFGGYGRREVIEYAHEFITREMNLDISHVTIYKGSENVPRDDESERIWRSIGIKDIKEDAEDVFWGPTGDSGPCGPTTEIYCKNANGDDVEVWNIVFNEYFCDGPREKLDRGEATLKKLDILGIDTGMGFERLVSIIQARGSVYQTDLFNNENTREERIVADHVKASLFMIADGVVPSNTGAGYVLRRLIRRAVRFSKNSLGLEIEKIQKIYKGIYILDDRGAIEKEENKFRETLSRGLKEFEKGEDPFILATTYGFPIELTLELAKEKGRTIDLEDFNRKMVKHQKLSQTSSAGMFKGGLVNHNEKTIKLHTAHHLLLAGLQAVVDKNIKQRGSNINEERLRMDFLCDHKLTEEEKKKVEDWVNDKIKLKLNVVCKEMPLAEAEKIGAEMEFGAKYPDIVSVYFIGPSANAQDDAVSVEFCGGPHVSNTGELGKFQIQKEEAVAQGTRRIKAIVS
ncbi:MAG: alanine--tRNA ligase-related protein [Candidatus Paceibacterota bacterium]